MLQHYTHGILCAQPIETPIKFVCLKAEIGLCINPCSSVFKTELYYKVERKMLGFINTILCFILGFCTCLCKMNKVPLKQAISIPVCSTTFICKQPQ